MIHAHLKETNSVPWAAIAAPLLGIPLMVAILAITSPIDRASVEPEGEVTTEQLEVQPIEHTLELDTDCVGPVLQRS